MHCAKASVYKYFTIPQIYLISRIKRKAAIEN